MHVMISCGEASGDLYAGALAHELQRASPGVRVSGFGGDRLRGAGADLIGDYRGLTATGLFEVLAMLPRSWLMYRRLVAWARAHRPDVFVAIDYPDFNFRLAAALRRFGVPIVYYISPQLWAWRPGRLGAMKRFVDRVLVIFPFEEAIYRDAGIPVDFVGHPLVDLTHVEPTTRSSGAAMGVSGAGPVVALLPGSRPNEIRAILPGLLGAARLIAQKVDGVHFVVARAPGLDDTLFDEIVSGAWSGTRPAVVESRTDEVLAACDLVLTASGTATVQAALHERPMVIVYKLGSLTYRLGKPFVPLDTYGMVNLIAGERVVPELIQDDFTPDSVAAEAVALLTNDARLERARAGLRLVVERLGGAGASRRAAAAILETADARRAGSAAERVT